MPRLIALIVALLCATDVYGQSLTPAQWVSRLQQGGLVIIVRHARSPREVPDETTANPDNTTRERQLDEVGREDATGIGMAMRTLKIPVGPVLTSPTYRARETVRLAGWTGAQTVPELGDRGRSMQGVTELEGAWLRKRVTEPAPGSNTILVTHLPNITSAFPKDAEGVEDGDALVFAAGSSGATLLGRIKAADWRTFK